MSFYERIIISGIGATTPLLSKVFVDYLAEGPPGGESIVNSVILLFVLFFAGGFWAYVNEGSMTKLQVFQLGIALPSLFFSSINANNLAWETKKSNSLLKQNGEYAGTVSKIEDMLQPNLLDESGGWTPPTNEDAEPENPAFNNPIFQTIPNNILNLEIHFVSLNKNPRAADSYYHPVENDTLKYKLKSFANTFDNVKLPWYKGNLSKSMAGTTENKWFVIVGIHKNENGAIKQRELINSYYKDIKAEVYGPYEGKEFYSVVIGERLTYKSANQLRQGALKLGFPKSTYLRAIYGKLEQAKLNFE